VQGYCHENGGACRRFPVLVGELGSRMRDCRNPCNNRDADVGNCMQDEMQVDILLHLIP